MKNKIIITVSILLGIWVIARAFTNNKSPTQLTSYGHEQWEIQTEERDEGTEVISFSHDWRQLVPNQISLKSGKDYTIEITPESNGKWCMSTIKREWTTSADAQLLIANKTINFSLPKNTAPGTYKLVCNGMWMEQGSIIIEA